MSLMVPLLPRWRECLLAHLPKTSSSRIPIEQAAEDYGYVGAANLVYCVWCDEDDAQEYLELAKQYCPDAVAKIQRAIRSFQSPS
jgi:hypothetical protein